MSAFLNYAVPECESFRRTRRTVRGCEHRHGWRKRRATKDTRHAWTDADHRAGLQFVVAFKPKASRRAQFLAHLSELLPVPA